MISNARREEIGEEFEVFLLPFHRRIHHVPGICLYSDLHRQEYPPRLFIISLLIQPIY